MKYSITCKVDSMAELDRLESFENEGYLYEFIPGRQNRLEEIRITVAVPNPALFHSTIAPGKPGGPAIHLTIKRDPEVRREVLLKFQKLESLLSFCGEVTDRIHWDAPKDNIICESEEELRATNVFGYQPTEKVERTVFRIGPKSLGDVVSVIDRFDSLIAPMAFWREGVLEHHSLRFINSFFNFYFVLEGIFGNGKTKNSNVEDEFLKSKNFRISLDSIIKIYRDDPRTGRRNELQTILARRGKQLDAEGVIHLLVRTRGELHHFSNNPNRLQGTPFTHKTFQPIADLAHLISTHVIQSQIVFINQKLRNSTP